MKTTATTLALVAFASPAAAQGLCEGGLFAGGLEGFFTSPRGVFLIACMLGAAVWGWFGLGMTIVVLHGVLFLLPALLGMARNAGADLTFYFDVMRACATLDYLFIMGVCVLAVLFLRDGIFSPRKPK